MSRCVGLAQILPAAVFGGAVGTILAWLTRRFAPRPRLTFVVICSIGLILPGIMPFSAAEETATGVWLNLMHLAVAVPVVGGLAAWLPDTKD